MKNIAKLLFGALVFIFSATNGVQKDYSEKASDSANTSGAEEFDEGEDFISTAKKIEGPIAYPSKNVSRAVKKKTTAQELLQDIDLIIKMRKDRGEAVNEEAVEIFKTLSNNIDDFMKGRKIDELNKICARLNVLRKQNAPEKEIVKLEYKTVVEIQRRLAEDVNKRINAGTSLDEMMKKAKDIEEGAKSFHREAKKETFIEKFKKKFSPRKK